jgi:hypothetical protein
MNVVAKEQMIFLEITEHDKNTTKAKIRKIKALGQKKGFGQLVLIGDSTAHSKVKGMIGYDIRWDKVSLNQKEVTLGESFNSKFISKGEIINRKVSASGNPKYLIDALNELKSDDLNNNHNSNQKKDLTLKSEEILNNYKGLTRGNSSVPDRSQIGLKNIEIPEIRPNFSTNKEIITPQNECSVKVDISQLVAIKQEKLEGGGCQESLVRYPLIKIYKSCPMDIDLDELKAFQQYNLVYDDPENSNRILVEGCRRDEDKFFEIEEITEGCKDVSLADGINTQSRLVYYNEEEMQVRKCQDSGVIRPYIITKDGCGMQHDVSNGVSYAQVRKIYNQDNGNIIVVKDCYNSEELFKHQKVYESCDVRIDYSKKLVFRQNKIIIFNGKEQIEVSGCIDSETIYPFVITEKGCEIINDFSKGISIGQSRAIYIDNGHEVEIDSCDENEKTYSHLSEDCEFIIDKDRVIKRVRSYINIDGDKKVISECLPSNNIIEVKEEICEENEFEHDFMKKQSFINKSYYYEYLGNKKYIDKCIKSNEFIDHLEEICSGEYDDYTKNYLVFQKTYIEFEGRKIFLEDCNFKNKRIPYVKLRNQWRSIETNTSYILLNNDYADSKTWWRSDHGETKLWDGWKFEFIESVEQFRSWPCDYGNHCYVGMHYPKLTWKSQYEYCLSGKAMRPWTTMEGKIIDAENSDQLPYWEIESISPDCSFGLNIGGKKICREGGVKTFEYRCNKPRCKLNYLELYPVYQRFDESIYEDLDVVIERKYICGDGHNILEGIK